MYLNVPFLYAHIQFKWCVYSFSGRMEKEPVVSLVKRPAMTRLPSVLRNNKKGEGERDAKMTDDYTQYIRWAYSHAVAMAVVVVVVVIA